MAKFKKLAILCTALVMSAGLATAAACAEDAPSSTPSTESSSADSSTPETSDPEDSSSEDSSEDSSGGEATTTYTVTVNAPAGVTVGGTLTAAKGEDVTFTLTAANNMFIDVSGAVYVSEVESGNNIVYTYKISAINRDRTVTVTQAYYRLVDTKTVTVNNYRTAPLNLELTPGTYILKSDVVGAEFGKYANSHFESYLFEVTDATPDLLAYIFDMSSEADVPIEVSYSIYEIMPINLTGTTKGSLTLLGNVVIPVSFTAPSAGKWKIASTTENISYGQAVEQEVYNSDWTEVIATETVYEFELTPSQVVELAEGETVNFYVKAESIGESFTFNYTISEAIATPIALGETEVTFNPMEEIEYTFTADKAGDYTFTFVGAAAAELLDPFATEACLMFGMYDAEYDYIGYGYTASSTFALAAGQTVSVYAKFYASEATAPITDTISVTYQKSSLLADVNTVNVNEENPFRAEEDGYYAITVDENETFSVDGGVTWISETEVYLSAGEEVNIIAKSDVAGATTATVTIEKVNYTLYAYTGDNTFSLKADKTYTLDLPDAQWYGEYTLTWDNENVVVYDADNEVELTSGSKIQWFWQTLTVTAKDGAAIDNFTLTVAKASSIPDDGGDDDGDDEYSELTAMVLGENKINVENAWQGVFLKFTAAEAGTYVLKAADDESNGWVDTAYYSDSFGWDRNQSNLADGVFTTYTFEATEAGQKFAFWVSTYNDSADEINLVIEAVAGEEEPTYIDFTIQGEETSIVIPAGKTAQTYPRMAGDYTFTWTGDAKIYVDNNVIANGATVSLWNSFIQIVPNDSSVDCTVVLTITEPASTGTGLTLGDNSIVVNDAWNGVECVFTATEAGKYTFKLADGETNGDIFIEDDYGGEWVGFPYSVTLEANESFTFILGTLNYQADTIDFVIVKEDSTGPALPDSNEDLKVGDTTIYMINEDGHSGNVYFTPEEDGTYVFSVEGAVVKTFANLSWRDLADNKLVATAGTKYTLRIVPNDSATTSVVVTITKEAAVEPDPTPVEAVLGTNAVAVPADKCVKATFTAAEEGTYRITLADGETNAIIKVNGEEITCPAQYELAANESVTFEVWSKLDTDDTIDFVISKYTGTDDPSTDSDEGNWTQNY